MARDTFHYHKIDADVAERMVYIRRLFIELAEFLEVLLPDGRSKALCLTHLEDALMRAIQSEAVANGVKQ